MKIMNSIHLQLQFALEQSHHQLLNRSIIYQKLSSQIRIESQSSENLTQLFMFHPKVSIFTPVVSDRTSIEQAEVNRFQRLILQRKRMEQMAQLILQQANAAQTLKKENQTLNQQFYEMKVEKQLINDKLSFSCNYSEDLAAIVLKQIGLIQHFKGYLFGRLQMTDYQKNLFLQQIQLSINLYHIIKAGGRNLNSFNTSEEIAKLRQQNQILSEKYEELRKSYFELSKNNNIKQFQNQQNNFEELSLKKSQASSNQNESIHKKSPSDSIEPLSQIIRLKDNEINQLKKKIQLLKNQIQQKNDLLYEHRINEQEQKKLVNFLKNKFHQEGKQIIQIAKSKNCIEAPSLAKTQIAYEIQKLTNCPKKKTNQKVLNTIFEDRISNEDQPSTKMCSRKFNSEKKLLNSQLRESVSGSKQAISKCFY